TARLATAITLIPWITAFQVGWLSAWIARGLVSLTPYLVPMAGLTTASSISRTHDVTYTRATGRHRGDGSRPSGNTSNSSPRNRKVDGHSTDPTLSRIHGAGGRC